MTPNVILITGASSGIGKLTAEVLADHGHIVFGTSRKASGETINGVCMLPLDVTSEDSATMCVAQVIEQAGRLDILINNAGVELFGALEELSIDEARWIYETNLFGVMRMVKAVLPHMRRRRAGSIINIGSVAGLVASPIHGMYASTKFALEGYTEALWHELADFGVHVALVEPGFFRSEIGSRGGVVAAPLDAYTPLRTKVMNLIAREIAGGPDPMPITLTILDIVEGRTHKLRHLVGYGTGNALLKLLLPDALVRSSVNRWIESDWRTAMMPTRVVFAALGTAVSVTLLALLRRRR